MQRHADPADHRRVTPPRVLVRPVPGAPRTRVRLFLTSATILFVELLLIRWIPANVVYVGYFSNLILMASFLGIGLGILFGRTGMDVADPALLAAFFAVVKSSSARPS